MTYSNDTYVMLSDGTVLILNNDGDDDMPDDFKQQGPIQVIGGVAAVIALVKKYYAPAMATVALVIWLVSYLTGKTDALPPPPPIWPAGLYVSDGVHPLAVATPEAIAAAKLK